MAGLCWVAVALVVFLSTGNISSALDQNQLAEIVNQILNRFTPSYGNRKLMFSLAVSIPYNEKSKMYDVTQVPDNGQEVNQTIIDCEVYNGTRVVAATLLKWPDVLKQCRNGRVQWPDVLEKCNKTEMTWAEVKNLCPQAVEGHYADHAEYRTLKKFNTLFKTRNRRDLLLFYVFASPCDRQCTNETHPWNILDSIKNIKEWDNYALVFSKVFKPRYGGQIPDDNLREALMRLGERVGLSNIYRCDSGQCTSCSHANNVTRYCLSDN